MLVDLRDNNVIGYFQNIFNCLNEKKEHIKEYHPSSSQEPSSSEVSLGLSGESGIDGGYLTYE